MPNQMKLFDQEALRALPGNDRCADCGMPNPEWASVSFGTVFCLECSGVHRYETTNGERRSTQINGRAELHWHIIFCFYLFLCGVNYRFFLIWRGLGVHISFVRSITMDSWTSKQVVLMMAGGNDKCKHYFKENGVPTDIPIKEKYAKPQAQNYKEVLRAQVEGFPEPPILPPTAESAEELQEQIPPSQECCWPHKSEGHGYVEPVTITAFSGGKCEVFTPQASLSYANNGSTLSKKRTFSFKQYFTSVMKSVRHVSSRGNKMKKERN